MTVLSDVLTRAGAPHQVLSHKIRAIGSSRFAGPAFCIKGGIATSNSKDIKFEVLRRDRPSVAVISTNIDSPTVVMGENVAIALKVRGCLGIVTDGGLRDKAAMEGLDIPIYASFASPIAPRGWQMNAIDVPVVMPGQSSAFVTIFPEDIIVGDEDGVIVVPASCAETVLDYAAVMMNVEDEMRQRLLSGEDPESVFALDRLSHIRPLEETAKILREK